MTFAMTKTMLRVSLFCLAAFGVACNSADLPMTVSDDPSASTEGAGPDELSPAIEHALEQGWDDLRIIRECRREGLWTRVWVFGDGVAIWDRQRQTTISRDQIHQALVVLQKSGFAAMNAKYGGKGTKAPEGEGAKAIQVTCSVSLELDGRQKMVVQLIKGYQFVPLLDLAEDLYGIFAAEGSGDAVTADDVDDGLAKIARGELALEGATILAHRKPELGSSGKGWLLQLVQGRLSVRAFDSETGYGETTELAVPRARLKELVTDLAKYKADGLPINLRSEEYREIKLEVLGHEVGVTARPFGGKTEMDPKKAEAQERFQSLFETLESFYEDVRP